jgi:hypothetical protein
MKREKFIKVRVSEDEKKAWDLLAANALLPLSELIRERMSQPSLGTTRVKRRLRTVTADPALLRQLSAMGNNLNQIARSLYLHGLAPADSGLLLSYLVSIQDELRQLREQGAQDAH